MFDRECPLLCFTATFHVLVSQYYLSSIADNDDGLFADFFNCSPLSPTALGLGGVELSKDALSTPLESACGVCTSRYLGVTPTPPQCTSHSYCLNSNSSRRCQKPTTLLLQYLFVSTSCVRTVFFFCIIATSLN